MAAIKLVNKPECVLLCGACSCVSELLNNEYWGKLFEKTSICQFGLVDGGGILAYKPNLSYHI